MNLSIFVSEEYDRIFDMTFASRLSRINLHYFLDNIFLKFDYNGKYRLEYIN